MKRIFLLAALLSAAASAQDRDISGAQLLSGEADAQLQSAAREASASGKKLVISAPQYWIQAGTRKVCCSSCCSAAASPFRTRSPGGCI